MVGDPTNPLIPERCLRWIAELSPGRPIRNLPPVLEQKAAVTGAVPVTHVSEKKKEGRVGGTSCGPSVEV